MRVINKIGQPRSGSPTSLITSHSYQLIKTTAKFEKQNNHWLDVFMNKDISGNARENEFDSQYNSVRKICVLKQA